MADEKERVDALEGRIDELEKNLKSFADDLDERLSAITTRLDATTELATTTAEGITATLEALQRRSGDGGYESLLEDKIAVLEWAVENQGAINLAEARKRVLGAPVGATESSQATEEPHEGAAGQQEPPGDAGDGATQTP